MFMMASEASQKNDNHKIKPRFDPSPTHETSTQDQISDNSLGGWSGPTPPPPPELPHELYFFSKPNYINVQVNPLYTETFLSCRSRTLYKLVNEPALVPKTYIFIILLEKKSIIIRMRITYSL